MRINEVIVEAISITQYEPTIEKAVNDGILQAMLEMSKSAGSFPKDEKLFGQRRPNNLFQMLRKLLSMKLSEKIASSIQTTISREIVNDIVLDVVFSQTPSARGRIAAVKGFRGDTMELDIDYIKDLTDEISTFIEAIYEEEPYKSNNPYAVYKRLATGKDTGLMSELEDNVKGTVDNLVSIVIHELVHGIQNHRQYQKGRDDVEYRSYLDRKKQKFPGSGNIDLYFASPQEITAHVHEMVLEIVRRFNLKNITSEEDIPTITSEDIMSFISNYLGGRFNDPGNPEEYKVFKRYVKQVYQEVQRYIDEKRRSFKPKESE